MQDSALNPSNGTALGGNGIGQQELEIGGYVTKGFETVREAFLMNFRSRLEVGATFAVVYQGELVVDLWGGYMDAGRTKPLEGDALFNLFSATKGLSAACIAVLVERGLLDYEMPVAAYWPEFGQCGKEQTTVAQLLSHQAGICGVSERVTIEDFYAHERVAALLAAQTPYWSPGSAWGYHGLTIGTLCEELVRRVDGRPLSKFFAEEIAGPLGLDIYLGLPEAEDHRQAEMIPPDANTLALDIPNVAASLAAFENPPLAPEWPNNRAWRAAGLACCGGSANARSLAKFYATLADCRESGAGRLLSPATLAAATAERVSGIDQASGAFDRYAAGFRLNVNGNMGPSPSSFGHPGWGGLWAYGDQKQGLGVAYVMNKMNLSDFGAVDSRYLRLLGDTYSSLTRDRRRY